MAFGNNNSRIWKIYLVLFKLFEGRLEIPFDVISISIAMLYPCAETMPYLGILTCFSPG